MERDATDISISGNTGNEVPNLGPDFQKAPDDARQEQNRKKELHFKASHGLVIGFFLWILYALTCH